MKNALNHADLTIFTCLHRFTNTSGVSCARSMKTTASSTSSSAAGAGTTGEEGVGSASGSCLASSDQFA